MNSALSNEEKKQLSYQRQNAVRDAWKLEKERVSVGIGTRQWSEDEKEELLQRGRVKGYEGHHMKSVSLYPEYAGDPRNIQFLSESEHLYGAHNGDYHNLTNGYYNPDTGIMEDFGDELRSMPTYNLKNNEALYSEKVNLKDEYVKEQNKQELEHDTILRLKQDYIKHIDDVSEYVSYDSKCVANGMSRR